MSDDEAKRRELEMKWWSEMNRRTLGKDTDTLNWPPDRPAEGDTMADEDDEASKILARLGTDAQMWAIDFIGRFSVLPRTGEMKLAPGETAGDWAEGVMIGWFASAIETGRSAGYAQAKREADPDWPLSTLRPGPEEAM